MIQRELFFHYENKQKNQLRQEKKNRKHLGNSVV